VLEQRPKSLTRRDFIFLSGSRVVVGGAAAWIWALSDRSGRAQMTVTENGRTREEWLDIIMERRALSGALYVSRFVERMYFLTKPIAWVPNSDQTNFQRVDVPVGFVTDFASIPRPFWSLLPPDGEYTYPAIIHDYLYWTQERTREMADRILEFGMQDLHVNSLTIGTIYNAVRVFGGAAWDENAELKKRGEKRFLKKTPDDPTIRWEDWKKQPNVFSD
jgi:hypothetical protein